MDYNNPHDLARRAILCGEIITWMAVVVIILAMAGCWHFVNTDPKTQQNLKRAQQQQQTQSEEP